ncbi:MAG: DUF6526 family protein [Acidobacteriota bacterium]|nr:DUF6526 family protein [Acidobacteriota bacterium]
MKAQNFANHTYFPTMTPVAGLPAVIALLLFVFEAFRHGSLEVFGLIALAFSAIVLALISRAYTVRLQDRIIRLEMRIRLEGLSKGSEFTLLSTPQLVALRFASDAELPDLVDRALKENLALVQIKRAVKDWQPDLHRT